MSAFGQQNQPIRKTPIGYIDSAHLDGNDGSNIQPVWNNTPDLTDMLVGTALSLDVVVGGYFVDPGSPTSELGFHVVSGTDPRAAGFSFAATVLQNSNVFAAAGTFQFVALRNGISVLSAPISYLITSASIVSDTVAPSIPTGVTAIPGSSVGTISLTFDPPSDTAPPSAPASGVVHVDVLVNNAVTSPPSPVITPANALAAPTPVNLGSISSPDTPTASQDGLNWTLTAAGTGITTTASEQALLLDYGTFSGQQRIVAQVSAFSSTAGTALVGIMLHETAVVGGKFIAVGLRPQNGTIGIYVVSRTAAAGTSAVVASQINDSNGHGIVGPVYLKIDRSADLKTLTVSYSLSEAGWTVITTQTIAMASAVHCGLFATSQSAGTDIVGKLSEVSINSTSPITVTLTAAQAVQIALRSVDSAGNTSGLSAAVTGIPKTVISGGAIKLHEGDYLWFDNTHFGTNLTSATAVHAQVVNNANIKGYAFYFHWNEMEGATLGDFSQLATAVGQIKSLIAGSNKRYIIRLSDRTFGGQASSIAVGGYPTYAVTAGYGLIANAPTHGVSTSVNFWNPACIARLIECGRQVALLCDNDPQFEGYDAMGETSWPTQDVWDITTVGGTKQSTDPQAYINAIQTLFTTMSPFFKKSWIRLEGNFVPTSNTAFLTQLFDNLLPLGNVIFGGPDPVIFDPTSGRSSFMQYWQGSTTGHDYRAERVWIGEVQEVGLGEVVAGTNNPALAGGATNTINGALTQIFQSQIGGLPGNANPSNRGRIMLWNWETQQKVKASNILAWIAANPTTSYVSPQLPTLGSWNTN